MRFLGMIADHPTPKISEGDVAFTQNSRDYKGVMIVVLSTGNARNDTERNHSEVLNRGDLLHNERE